jgi:hypothetical protein
MSSSDRHKLRVGLFADNRLQPRWTVEAFARLATFDFAEVVVIAARNVAPAALPWLRRAYDRIDKRMFGSGLDPSARIDLVSHIGSARFLDWSDRAPAAREHRSACGGLDVAFALGDSEDMASEASARYGVWRFCFGEQATPRDGMTGWQEVADRAPVTASSLRVRPRPGATERLAYQSWSRTFPLSFSRNRENVLRKTAEFAHRALRELHRFGHTWLDQLAPAPRVPEHGPGGIPGNLAFARDLSRLGMRIGHRAAQRLLSLDQWFLAYRFAPEGRIDEDFSDFITLMPPGDRFWADPFPVKWRDRYYLFFEEMPFATRKGHIAVMEIGPGTPSSRPVKVLERDYHLSYPFIFEWQGNLYMLPESGANRTVELYRCTAFPYDWQLEKVLLADLRSADATLCELAGCWWMFVNVGVEGTEPYDELHIYHADSPLGPWRPHARNPVKSDVRCARPAGRLYHHRGDLYRPAQICAPLYGSGISVNRVVRLTPEEFEEKEVRRILPIWGRSVQGIHTLNHGGGVMAMDGFIRRPRWPHREERRPFRTLAQLSES